MEIAVWITTWYEYNSYMLIKDKYIPITSKDKYIDNINNRLILCYDLRMVPKGSILKDLIETCLSKI